MRTKTHALMMKVFPILLAVAGVVAGIAARPDRAVVVFYDAPTIHITAPRPPARGPASGNLSTGAASAGANVARPAARLSDRDAARHRSHGAPAGA
jgi:hypothetical protein